MPKLIKALPRYRKHKASGQAVVTLNGKDFYLGPWRSKASKMQYEKILAEWLTAGRRQPPDESGDLTVVEVMSRYWTFAKGYYRKDGKPTSELRLIPLSMRQLRRLYGKTPAVDFGPLALKTVIAEMEASGLCRRVVNAHAGRIKRMYKWAVANELVPASVYQALTAVSGLRRGRSKATDYERIGVVSDAYVNAVRPYVADQVWAMIELQLLTGMRPGEVCQMRTCDIDTAGKIWFYRPASHKTAHHGYARIVDLGPRAQEILQRFLKPELETFIFSPRDAEDTRHAQQREDRQTPMTPSQASRRPKRRPGRTPGDAYTTDSYRRAIARACDMAHPPAAKLCPRIKADGKRETQKELVDRLSEKEKAELAAWRKANRWHPHQLRHNFATRVRKEYGLDAARAMLGQHSVAAAEIYADADRSRGREIAAKIG